ncbi:sensor histidine kinase [Haloactinomyces albus]|uniref:Two-component system CitB family sensor kinase n=1 Tax=Haloactinomyces albus TaxID=1352928 RepID=A0AAE3ZDQ2_9ACTN|nr:sensor histidine kinase [Haloactinomyces albus]MDR7301955.1 two-component system CitB family sensor kinase [Haloactinomyces albus]
MSLIVDDRIQVPDRNRRARRLSLAGQFFALQLVLVVIALVASGVFWWRQTRVQLDEQYAQRVLAIAESVATMPAIREAFDDPRPARTIAPLAERIRRATGASFVVVANERQIRYSHPVPARIGGRLSTDASIALSGRPWTGVQTGTTGRSMRAKTPVLDTSGEVIGVVSVGVPVADVADEVWETLPALVGAVVVLVGVGAAGTYLIFRRMRRQTFGLAADEIGTLVEHRMAMLHALKEGVVACDPSGRITLVNDEARRLLGLPDDVEGRDLEELGLPERLHDVLAGQADGADQIVLRGGRVLALNRMPVRVDKRDGGSVVTLRDRTQLDQLARELDGARTTTDALRAQAHEFSNRIHTIAGLLELGEYEEARAFVDELSATRARFTEQLTTRVRDPAVAALLLAKSAAAGERDAELVLAPETDLGALPGTTAREDLILVVGNLVDNAVDSLSPGQGWVRVSVRPVQEEGMAANLIEVRDSGSGITPELVEEVFRAGFTTKVAQQGGTGGLGLALVRQTCRNRGGWVRADNDEGAVFTALLPVAEDRADPDGVSDGVSDGEGPGRAGSGQHRPMITGGV